MCANTRATNGKVLTHDVDDLKVDVKGDERDGQEPEVELEQAGDGVDVVVLLLADLRHLAVCNHRNSSGRKQGTLQNFTLIF